MLRTRVRAGAAAGLVLSLLFAGVFTAVSLFELYIPALTPSYGRPTLVTLRVPYGPRLVSGAHWRHLVRARARDRPSRHRAGGGERRARRRLRVRVHTPSAQPRAPRQLLRHRLHRLHDADDLPASVRAEPGPPPASPGRPPGPGGGLGGARQGTPALHGAARVLDPHGGAARSGSRSPSIGGRRSSSSWG